MHVLVTGGAGFIGSQIVEFHLSRGDKVHVVDDLSTGSMDNLKPFLSNPNFHFDEADILAWPDLNISVAWADRIYHMAAIVGMFHVLENSAKLLEINIAATERLFKAARESNWQCTILLASTSEVYGNGLPDRPDAEFAETDLAVVGENSHLRWNYSISKLVDEAYALSYAKCFGVPIITVRLFNTIGPRQTGKYGMVVPRFIRQAVFGEPITVFGDGSQKRSFCDVRDTVAMLNRLAENEKSIGEIVNVGNNHEISILELARMVKRLANSNSEIKIIPYEEAYGTVFEDIMHRRPCIKKITALTGIQCQWTLENTILELIEQIRQDIDSQEN